MFGYAFEFVAGKSIPAFFGALSRVAEGFENVQAMRPFIIPQRKHASSRATAVLVTLADFYGVTIDFLVGRTDEET